MAKGLIIFVLFWAIMLSSFSLGISAYELTVEEASTDGYYLYNIENDLVMLEYNSDNPISPSSTVKMMTACIALESGIDEDTVIRITEEMLEGVVGRNMRLKAGDRLIFKDLLYATICGGYNDAAQVLALSTCDDLSEFVAKMNDKANELGMNSTKYTNVSGVSSPETTTTVTDIAILAKYLSQNERYVEIGKTKSYKISDGATCQYTTVSNRSSLLATYRGMSNLNTGEGNGDCAVLYYDTGDLSYITVVMNTVALDPDDESNYAEIFTQRLIYHARNDYSVKTVIDKNTAVATVPVKYSVSYKEISLYLQEDLSLFLPNETDPSAKLNYSVYIYGDEIKAPVKSGETVGELTVSKDGKILAVLPLLIETDLERNGFLYIMDIMKSFVMSRSFIVIVICFVALMVIYYISKSRKLNKMHKRRKIKRKK